MKSSDPLHPPQIFLIDQDDSRRTQMARILFRGFPGGALREFSGLPELASVEAGTSALLVAADACFASIGTADEFTARWRESPLILISTGAEGSPERERLSSWRSDVVRVPVADVAFLPRMVHRGLNGMVSASLVPERPLARLSGQALGGIADAADLLLFVHGGDGTIVDVECGLALPIASSVERLVGATLADILPPASASAVSAAIEAVLRDATPRTIDYPVTILGSQTHFQGRLVRQSATHVLAVLRDITLKVQAAQAIALLSRREHQVLTRIILGETNKEIAAHLGIGVKTIETHRAGLMKKLKARTVADLVRIAFRAEVPAEP